MGALRAAGLLEVLLIRERSCQTEVSQALRGWQALRVSALEQLTEPKPPKAGGISLEGSRAGGELVSGG